MNNIKVLFNKTLLITIITLLIGVAFATCFSVGSKEIVAQGHIKNQDEKVVTCYVFNKMGNIKHEVVLSSDDFDSFYSMFKDLNYMINYQPLSSKNEVLKSDFADLLENLGMIPKDLSEDDIISLMNPSLDKYRPLFSLLPNPISNGRGSAFFCNFATWGEGSQFPVIILPRLIPILLVPIPRVAMCWNAVDGVTSCGGLLSGKGFIAEGAQKGTALGFWGIGFSVFLPPVMSFGFIGYALFATATAENIIPWPPNRPPVVSGEDPLGGTWDVPLGLSELSFRIEDADGDRMSYWVTTDPDIGSGEGHNKKNGVYSVPVNGVECDRIYSWTIRVTDDKEIVEKTYKFISEGGPPFDPFNEGWSYRKKITIDHSMVAGSLSDFPVLVSLADSDLKDKAQEGANDILFMDGDGVAKKLYHEIELFDGSSGELVTWVRIPSLSSSENTVLYMYYGNSGCSGQQFPEKVWKSDFIAVYHMSGSKYTDVDDSTSNNLDVIEKQGYPTFQVSGKIGLCVDFDEASLNVDDNDLLSFTYGANQDKPFTVEAWVKFDGAGGDDNGIISKYANMKREWLLRKHSEDRCDLRICDDSTEVTIWRETSSKINVNNMGWNYVASAYSGTESGYSINMMLDGTINNGEARTSPNYYGTENLDEKMRIGAHHSHQTGWHYWQGLIDEVRISNIARSPEWLTTSYNTINDPSIFFSVGPEESAP